MPQKCTSQLVFDPSFGLVPRNFDRHKRCWPEIQKVQKVDETAWEQCQGGLKEVKHKVK